MRGDKIPAKAFGEVIKELRTQAGISQDHVAALAHTERGHISSMERGLIAPSFATIFTISEALNIAPDKLIFLIKKKIVFMRDGSNSSSLNTQNK